MITLKDVWYIPSMDKSISLFSLLKAQTWGFKLETNCLKYVLRKGSFNMIFDKQLKTKRGHVMAAKLRPVSMEG